jgi:hypothetical protein
MYISHTAFINITQLSSSTKNLYKLEKSQSSKKSTYSKSAGFLNISIASLINTLVITSQISTLFHSKNSIRKIPHTRSRRVFMYISHYAHQHHLTIFIKKITIDQKNSNHQKNLHIRNRRVF